MNLSQLLDVLRGDGDFMANVAHWETVPARPARYGPFPPGIDDRWRRVLSERGINKLYSHQAEAIEYALAGRDVVVVTPTASGKTLCYNMPVIQTMLDDPAARAVYLFPTKALARDQRVELAETVDAMGVDIKTYTYDGDTPPEARRAIRKAGHVIMTNPDMLHAAILPHHTRWLKLFENLRYVIIDELHTYRGVFGSHLANVIRRLRRLCRFYGSDPVFIMSSATIANPKELADGLTGKDAAVVDDSGAPRGARHLVFYNPPVVDRRLGIRRSSRLEARRLGSRLIANDIQTLIFTRTRLGVEILVSYLRADLARRRPAGSSHTVRGYRGGYLPNERRAIEEGLRWGTVRGVVSTNALELGIDIGSLEATIMVGYPGTIASTWQQAGRAGRRSDESLAVLIASSAPLDQYLASHPEWFFGSSPESARINPENLYIFMSHVKCAAFELPFTAGEVFGPEPADPALEYLEGEGVLRRIGSRWHWMADHFPAADISLRSALQDNFVIIDRSSGAKVIGEVDRFSAPLTVHEEAIYLHEGTQYQVEELDYDEKKAYVRPVKVDYYTDANLAVTVKVLHVLAEEGGGGRRTFGEVLVTAKATIFKKIRFDTHENIGWGKISLPEEQLHTAAYWLTVDEGTAARLSPPALQAGLHGLANVLGQVAPLYLMCDPRDLHTLAQVRAPFSGRPTIYFYDAYPGGIGLAERLYDLHTLVLETGRDLLTGCGCESGCPACVGPEGEVGAEAKSAALVLLEGLL